MTYDRKGPRLKGRRPWDRQAMAEVAQVAIVAQTQRAMVKGLGNDDRPMKPYSRRPTYISVRAFPKPRGGRPSASGRSVYFPGGYAQYKRGIAGNARVNLTSSGRMRRSFRTKTLRRLLAVIGLSGTPAVYGRFVNERRPWIGLSRADREIVKRAVSRALTDALKRTTGRVG
jgi:hypothetical protein